jgi:hypothetical protein
MFCDWHEGQNGVGGMRQALQSAHCATTSE